METDNTNQPVPPVQNTKQSQSTPPTPPNHSKIFIIITSVLLLAMIGVGSYVLGTRKHQTVNQQSITTSPTISQLSPTPDPTANWKTYINPKYNYSIEYPPSWNVIEESSESFSIESTDKQVSPDSGYTTKGAGVNIDAEKTLLKSLDEVYEAYLKKNKTYIDRGITKIISKASITINGIPALKVVTKTIEAPEGFDIHLLNYQTHITIQFWQVDSNYQNIFDQTLSTFQFSN